MKERFYRLDFEPVHEPQIITYANFINNQDQKRTGSITFWINFVPWSKHAWLWSEFIAAPPDPPDPPDIPEVSLDEAHAAFTATLPALTVSDTACAQVDAAAAAFTDGVSDDDVSVVYCKRKRNILWNVRDARSKYVERQQLLDFGVGYFPIT